MKRTFIAIKLPLAKQAAELIEDIKVHLADEKIKWVDTWNIHITLHFLGNTEEDLLGDIGNEISNQLNDIKSFKLQCRGVGLFKNLHNPKVLWFGIDQSAELNSLKEKVDGALKPFGFYKEERFFKPHVTLGRIKYIKNKEKFNEVVNTYRDINMQEFTINEVYFYESELTPKGPVYKVIRKFDLS